MDDSELLEANCFPKATFQKKSQFTVALYIPFGINQKAKGEVEWLAKHLKKNASGTVSYDVIIVTDDRRLEDEFFHECATIVKVLPLSIESKKRSIA